jgi:hypothetical protein
VFTNYSWWLLLSIPLYAGWKAFGLYFQYAHAPKEKETEKAAQTKAELKAQRKQQKREKTKFIVRNK